MKAHRTIRRLALIALLTLPFPAFAKSIVIVGGGLAGLTTAYELQKFMDQDPKAEKDQIDLYEAKERPGGRVFTVHLNGRPAEMGGENLNDGGDAQTMRQLAQEFGIHVLSRKLPAGKRDFFDSTNGKRYSIEDLKTYFPAISKKEMAATLAEGEGQSKNLREVIDFFFHKYPSRDSQTTHQRAVIRKAIEQSMWGYEGGDVKHLSTTYAHGDLVMIMSPWLAESKPKPSTIDSIEGGNSTLVLALAKKLGERLHLNSPLVKMRRASGPAGGFDLGIRHGSATDTIHADVVILAIPCKPYKNIAFGPGTIPPARLHLIESVGYGTHAKIAVPSEHTDAGGIQTQGASVWTRPDETWFTIFFSGPAGIMRNQSELHQGVALASRAVGPALHLGAKDPIAIPTQIFEEFHQPVAKVWTLDPYFQATYSYSSPELADQLEKSIVVEGEKVLPLFAPIDGRIFFAGEHTTLDLDIRGTMEAAAESGVRAAKLVWKELR